MEIKMNAETIRELDTITLRMYQRRGLYRGFSLEQYQPLKEEEGQIAKSPEIKLVEFEKIVKDFARNGVEESQLMPKAFLSGTLEESRKIYQFGYERLIVHFGTGIYVHNQDWELGLISSHAPGSPSEGGWGSNGTRKLQLARKNDDKKFNWERWIGNTLAWAYEHRDGRIHYASDKDECLTTLLRIAIEQERAKK
ncbi:MAG: hypothetical protein V2A62_03105 [Candidatus Woesearchaeota archaeon]